MASPPAGPAGPAVPREARVPGEAEAPADPGTALRALREQGGLTIASLARKVGLSAAAIRAPSPGDRARLA